MTEAPNRRDAGPLGPGRYAHCRHYDFQSPSGMMMDGYPVCGRGRDLSAPIAWGCCMPDPTFSCSQREEFTAEEFAVFTGKAHAAIGRMFAVMSAIPHARRGDCGTIECPACRTGTVRYGFGLRDGKLMAVCSTPGCCTVVE